MYNVLLLCSLSVRVQNAWCEMLGAKRLLGAKRMLSATYLPGGLCAVGISLFVCSYTVYVVYINMRLTVT